jgi:hypothetical protein
MYPDLDDVADGLLAAMGLPDTVSEPCFPTGLPVMSIQHYDIPKSLDQLRAILDRNDFEMQTHKWHVPPLATHMIWVRRRLRTEN